MRRRVIIIVILAIASFALAGAGGDHPQGPVRAGDGPPKPPGLHDLFNRPERVHGYWVNASDTFFYAGDTAALNTFLEAYARVEGVTHRVTLHVGPGRASSPWDDGPRDLDADWALVTSALVRGEGGAIVPADPYDAEVRIWLGRRVGLDGLEIPGSIDVASGGELERFVADHGR